MAKYYLHGGRIFTATGKRPFCTAMAVVGRRVIALGSEREVEAVVDSSFKRINISGKAVVPAFTDSHIHFMHYALGMLGLDLNDASTPDHVAQMVRDIVPSTPSGSWIVGYGWNKNTWQGGKLPDRSYLDAVAPHVPVVLISKDMHSMWVNTAVLRLAGIGLDTPDPEGGRIVRDGATRQATGLLRETAGALVNRVMPEPGLAQIVEAMERAQASLHRQGIAGIHNMDGGTAFSALQLMRRMGKLRLRTVQAIPVDAVDAAIDVRLASGLGDEWLRMGSVKIFADGSLGSQTARLLRAYDGSDGNIGIETTSKEEIAKIVGRAVLSGISCAIHAIGDRANRDVLDVFSSVKDDSAARGLTHRIEHAQLLHPDDVRRFADFGVIASMQPAHILTDIPVADKYWGRRSRWAFAFKSLLKSGATLAFGSDAPVETPDPLKGIYAAVARRLPQSEGEWAWYPEERVTIEEAVRAFTVGAAAAAGEPAGSTRATLAPGALADLAILSSDIFAMPAPDLLSVAVQATMVDGQFVYEEENWK